MLTTILRDHRQRGKDINSEIKVICFWHCIYNRHTWAPLASIHASVMARFRPGVGFGLDQ